MIFPTEFSVGKLYVLDRSWSTRTDTPTRNAINARGAVEVSRGQPLRLDLSYDAGTHPDKLSSFSKTAIVYLKLRQLPVGDDYISSVVNNFKSLKRLDLERLYITDKGLSLLAPFENLETLSCQFCSIKGPGLGSLTKFKKLKYLWAGFNMTDPSLMSSLTNLQQLRSLNLRAAKLNDPGLVYIGKITRLESLDLKGNPKITDAGLQHLSNLRRLNYLNVDGCAISIDGIIQLKHLPLTRIELAGDRTSPRDLSRLQKAFPKAMFNLGKSNASRFMDIFEDTH